jgi:hypothetical protein
MTAAPGWVTSLHITDPIFRRPCGNCLSMFRSPQQKEEEEEQEEEATVAERPPR